MRRREAAMDRALWKEVCDSAVFDLTTPGITGNEENTLYNSYLCIACWTILTRRFYR